MKKVILIILGFNLIGCAPEFYSPNRVNIPELKNKNDLKVSAARGYLGLETQFAYAITKNIGVIANYANYLDGEDENGFDAGNGSGIEFGGGYFTSKKDIIFENYATIGFGNFYNYAENLSTVEEDDGKLNSQFTKISLQSSMTLQKKFFSLSAGIRYTNLTYNDVQGNYVFLGNNLGDFLRDNPGHSFIEPVVQLGVGYKSVRFNLQYQHSYYLGNASNFYYNNFNYSAGIQLSFPAIGSKKKQTPTIN